MYKREIVKRNAHCFVRQIFDCGCVWESEAGLCQKGFSLHCPIHIREFSEDHREHLV